MGKTKFNGFFPRPIIKRKKKGPSQSRSHEEENARRSLRAVRDGEFGKACQALLSEGIAEGDQALEDLRSKHPRASPPSL